LILKCASAVAGVFGSLAMATFWLPPRLRGYGRLGSFAIVAGIGCVSALFGHAVLMRWVGMNPEDMDQVLPVSGCIGLLSFAVVNWLANFVAKRENSDALAVMAEVRGHAPHGVAPTEAQAHQTPPPQQPPRSADT
jgi:hypothetical protein